MTAGTASTSQMACKYTPVPNNTMDGAAPLLRVKHTRHPCAPEQQLPASIHRAPTGRGWPGKGGLGSRVAVSAACGGRAFFGALLFFSQSRRTYNVEWGIARLRLPSLISCSHYVICGPALPSFHKRREGREGGSAGSCLLQPFWCAEPSQNSNGKSIHRQGEASVQRGACVQAGESSGPVSSSLAQCWRSVELQRCLGSLGMFMFPSSLHRSLCSGCEGAHSSVRGIKHLASITPCTPSRSHGKIYPPASL